MVLTYRLENTFVLMITLYFLHFTNVDFYDLSLISVYNLKKLLHIFHHGRSLSHKITNCFKLSVLFSWSTESSWMITENIIDQCGLNATIVLVTWLIFNLSLVWIKIKTEKIADTRPAAQERRSWKIQTKSKIRWFEDFLKISADKILYPATFDDSNAGQDMSHEDLDNFDDDEEFTPRFSFWRPKSRAWTNG